MPEIFCNDCRTKVGTIQKANLMKGIVYQCPKCANNDSLKKASDVLKSKTKGKDPLGDILNGIFK